MFCTAWPDAPLVRLSSTATMMARPATRSATTPMNVMLEPRTHRAAGAGHSRLGIDHDLVRFDRLVLEERNERQLRAGRIAAGIGDEARAHDLAAIDFDEPVNGLAEQFGRLVLVAVPVRIGGAV